MAAGAFLAAALAMSCSSNPTQPTPTPALTLSCPASVTSQSPDGNAVVVTFTAPVVSGGAPPVTSTCSSQSGWTYPVGSTAVTCTATDAKQQSASCSFQVNITAPPQLTATKFVAFGDSITLGVESSCENSLLTIPRLTWFEELKLLQHARLVSYHYPGVLQGLLAQRYATQDITVVNEGKGGECPIGCDPRGVDRLPGVLAARMPQWLLLQEGVNNINADVPSSIPNVINGLRQLIQQAKAAGVPVMVGTLLPERPISEGGCRGRGPELIAPANDQIRALVQSEGQVLVDLYEAFGGVPGTLIGVDGLHPTEEGYAKMAETFYEEIKKRLEAVPQTARPGLSSRPGPARPKK